MSRRVQRGRPRVYVPVEVQEYRAEKLKNIAKLWHLPIRETVIGQDSDRLSRLRNSGFGSEYQWVGQ